MDLLDTEALTRSAVVANNAMNRERRLSGPNSYARELGFDPSAFLRTRPGAAWLDLCCGAGHALRQAAEALPDNGITLVGVDLVDHFAAPDAAGVAYVCAEWTTWDPGRRFDLITCVHGLHYVGDKLEALRRAASWLTDDGTFVADCDLDGIALDRRTLLSSLRRNGFQYDARKRRITLTGRREVVFPFAYLGADDHAGPNYTGQPAVRSHYR
ncbi:class I SAM-dependent methyltransferase [Hamadaea tsunoensis]|uniref:class I SAM-dependent methyltransferase n=1 Tax=Hamadaea tsunoensis TaxID=53368 RepID=UPI00041E83E7|nr:class I SAM-dependent methyltransferase [Hamadaea tsunoensis]